MGWDEDQLTHAFAVLPQVEQKAVQEGSPVVDGLVAEWQADPQFAEDDKTDLREAARLVALVGVRLKCKCTILCQGRGLIYILQW